MHACMHTYIHTYIHIYVYIHACTQPHKHTLRPFKDICDFQVGDLAPVFRAIEHIIMQTHSVLIQTNFQVGDLAPVFRALHIQSASASALSLCLLPISREILLREVRWRELAYIRVQFPHWDLGHVTVLFTDFFRSNRGQS